MKAGAQSKCFYRSKKRIGLHNTPICCFRFTLCVCCRCSSSSICIVLVKTIGSFYRPWKKEKPDNRIKNWFADFKIWMIETLKISWILLLLLQDIRFQAMKKILNDNPKNSVCRLNSISDDFKHTFPLTFCRVTRFLNIVHIQKWRCFLSQKYIVNLIERASKLSCLITPISVHFTEKCPI